MTLDISNVSSKAQVDKLAETIKERFKHVSDAFDGTEYSPAKSKEFVKFVRDTLSEACGRYVFGIGTDAAAVSADPKGDELKKQGFTVSETPAATKPAKTEENPRDNIVVQHAMALGFDPNSEE